MWISLFDDFGGCEDQITINQGANIKLALVIFHAYQVFLGLNLHSLISNLILENFLGEIELHTFFYKYFIERIRGSLRIILVITYKCSKVKIKKWKKDKEMSNWASSPSHAIARY